ncbi:MAG: hypothetical protein HW416_1728, partial [Chloroflexi bacterium]|nr:hypothetical protein [Chloroflexota bacterium]
MNRLFCVGTLLMIALAGCAPSSARSVDGQSSSAGSAEPAAAPKTIVLAQLNPTKGYSYWGFADTGGGGFSLAGVHTVGLVTQDAQGRLQGRLATRMPSLDDG